MDELDMLRAVRPRDDYPGEMREATRTRLLTAMATPAADRSGRPARGARRISWPWQAGLAAGLAAGATIVVLADGHGAAGGAHAQDGSAAQVLFLAANAAGQSALPAGARWVVWENRSESTASSTVLCGGVAKSATAQAYLKLGGVLTACPAQPPASLPTLRGVKPVTAGGPNGYPDPAGLPGQPGPLLKAVYNWYEAHYLENADSLPGHPVPPLSQAGLHAGAFDVLRLMLTSGVSSPSPAVQLRALALIPGIRIVANAHNAVGRPGVAVTMTAHGDTAAEVGFSVDEIIFDAQTYQDIGGVLVQPAAGGGSVTESTTQVWQAYYDANGHRL